MKFLPTLIIIATFLIPDSASAAGFVPCSGTDCSACNFVQMANQIIVWLITMSFLFFAVLAVVAGFGLVTSGGNTSALQAAKDKFTNAFIGLIIILAAFLIVDVLMVKLLAGGTGEISGFGPWSEVECRSQAVPDMVPQDNPSDQVEAPTDVSCSDVDALIVKYDGSPVGLVNPQLNTLIACYRADPAINAHLDTSQIYTIDRSNPICAATNGMPVCSPCSHSFNSCHYGRGSGRGASAVDFNASGITETQLYILIKDRYPECGGRIQFETNHTHISTDHC